MSIPTPLYREVQYYRELPPFTLLAVVGTLFGWFLIIWVVVLGRPLGSLDMPLWLGLAIGLPFGILLPLAYRRLNMKTEVYDDRIVVNNGMSGRMDFPLAKIAQVDVRTDDIRDDYNVRNIGQVRTTRTAYTVTSDHGVQLSLDDGRLFLIGSKEPQAFGEAVLPVWRRLRPEPAAEEEVA